MFYIQNIKPSDVVILKYQKNKYIVTDGLDLFDMSTGKIFGELAYHYEQIEKVWTHTGKLLAVRQKDVLLRYDPVRHNKDLRYLRHVNGLLTFEELKQSLEQQNIHYGLLHVTYKKTLYGNRPLKIYGGKKKYQLEFGSYNGLFLEKKKDKFGKLHRTGAKNNVQINIYRFLVDKKRSVYLYKYTITPCIL